VAGVGGRTASATGRAMGNDERDDAAFAESHLRRTSGHYWLQERRFRLSHISFVNLRFTWA
jgi:hypothetical protein